MDKSHEQKTAEAYAHDYRDMKMSEQELYDMLISFCKEGTDCTPVQK